jgi:hypothetical protein
MNNLQLVRKLSAQDALLLIKERGLSDAAEVLEFLSPIQVQQILDLDAWKHDQIDPAKMENWLEALYEASPARAVQAFHELDIELSAFLLKTHTQIYHVEMCEEPSHPPEQVLYTPDGRFMIAFHGRAVWRQILEQLMARDLQYTLGLIESIRYETESVLEEEALRWRDGRMQDLGFAPFEESKAILALVNPNDPSLRGGVADAAIHDGLLRSARNDEHTQPISSSILRLVNQKGLFQQSFERLNEAQQVRVLQELVSTCNRVHVAFNRQPGELTALKETVTYVVLMIEKALEHFTPEHLGSAPIAKLFQVGRFLASAP